MRRFFVVLGRVIWVSFVFFFSLFILIGLSGVFFPGEEYTPFWYVFVLIGIPSGLMIVMIRHYQRKDATHPKTPKEKKIAPPKKRNPKDVFTVFNAQTPNDKNDQICSVGLARVEHGEVIYSDTMTINPGCSIIPSHSARHGVHDWDVITAPFLPEAWEKLRPLFYDSVIVSHNSPFHLAVLGKALHSCGISPPPVRYFDTLAFARAHYPDGIRKSLSALCSLEGIPYYSHTALAHAQATAQLLLRMTKGKAPKRYVKVWVFGEHLRDDSYFRR